MVRCKIKDTVDVAVEVAVETKIEITCAHHWIIEPATGTTSLGVCKLCSARKEFSNQFKRNSLISPDFTSLSTATPKDGESEKSRVPVTESV